VSGDGAFARGTAVLTLEPLDGAPSMVVRARGVSIMKREQDGWKIARGITNLDQASGPTSPEKAG
jgi:ketosteroid isomerase-like protein